MTYALDLSPRQTARTLEQAARHGADVLVVPRVRPDDEPIACRLQSLEAPTEGNAGRACLVVVPHRDSFPAGEGNEPDRFTAPQATPDRDSCEDLPGTYCDVTIQLGENRYLFCSDVVAVWPSTEAGGGVRIGLARPETIQVSQRRRFWRFRPARSSQVGLCWTDGGQSTGQGVGWLCNVSGDGLACRVDARVADQLGIGERVKANFALGPTDSDRFALEATVCSKTPAGTQGTMIVGLQFLTGPGHESSADAADALRRQLLAACTRTVDVGKGAEA